MGAFKVRNAVIREKKRVPPKNGHFEIAKFLALFCIYLFRADSRIIFSKKSCNSLGYYLASLLVVFTPFREEDCFAF